MTESMTASALLEPVPCTRCEALQQLRGSGSMGASISEAAFIVSLHMPHEFFVPLAC